MGKIELLIIERKIIAKDTVEISFDLVNQDFKFQAGQYIQISIPVHINVVGRCFIFQIKK